MNRIVSLLRQNLTIRIALYLMLIAVVTFFVSVAHINSTVQEIRQKRAVLANRQNIQLNFEHFLAFYSEEYQNLSSNLNLLRPETDDVVQIIDSIETRSRALGLDVDIRNVPVNEEKMETPIVRYSFSFSGNKNQLISFLQMIEDLPTFIEIKNVSAEQVEEFGLTQLADYNVVFDIFVQ